MKVISLTAALGLSLALFVNAALADGASSGWRKLYEEEGILVSTREEAGRDMPSLRGQAKLNVPILHLLAIILDDARSKEWAKGADETSVLEHVNARTEIIYARSRQPWPVKDRDLVMQRTVEVLEPGHAYRVHLVCLPGHRPELPNVVRMQSCETSFSLRAVDAGNTQIDYRVHADPGGHFPDWIVRLASKSIPLDTLNGLVKQAQRTRGSYSAAVAQWSTAL